MYPVRLVHGIELMPVVTRVRVVAVGAGVALLLAACASGEVDVGSESPVPEDESSSGGEPSAEDEGSGTAGPEAALEELIAAAQEEGELQVLGTPDPQRAIVLDAFSNEFGINVEETVGRGELQARVQAERAAGQYNFDLHFGGNVSLFQWHENGWLDPIVPVLEDPSLLEPDTWNCTGCDHTGPLPFIDPGNDTILRLVNTVVAFGMYNTDEVALADVGSFDALLDETWRGRIALKDPAGGSGQFSANLFRAFGGDEFVEALYQDMDALINDDSRLLEENMLRGTRPLLLSPGGSSPVDVEPLKAEGHPVDYIWTLTGGQVDADAAIYSSGQLVGLVNQAANPHAAKLFVNWIMSEAGATAYAEALGLASTRADASNEWVMVAESIPSEDSEYLDLFSWEQTLQLHDETRLSELGHLTGSN